jgi:hypothetical protein
MKRVELIEWGIVTVALILACNFFFNLLDIFMQVLVFKASAETVLKMLLASAIYFVATFLLIRKSDKLAEFINGSRRSAETIGLSVGKRALLHVVIVSVCIVTALSGVVRIVYSLFSILKREVTGTGLHGLILEFGTGRSDYDLVSGIIQTISAIVVIGFSKKIADALIKKNELDELTLDSKPGN